VASGSPAVIQNNVFSGRSVEAGYDINHAGDPSNSTMDYNLFYPGAGKERIRWGGSSDLSLEQFRRSFPPHGRNSLVADPRFVNVAARDFRLSSGSAALHAGTAWPSDAYGAFTSLYETSILKDISGRERPLKKRWDIGAYQGVNSASAPEDARLR